MEVDGKIGHDTVKAMQSWLGTQQDGIVSGQSNRQKKYLIACVSSAWKFSDNPKGSLMVKALQRKLGCAIDGIMGKNTVTALQRMLGIKQDGYLGSDTAKALQIYLNNL